MEFCCSQFKAQLNERNQRGSSIYVCPPTRAFNEPSFVLLSRGIDKGREDVLSQIPRGTKLEINVSARVRIRFCPWCGRELKTFYAASYEPLIDHVILAEMKEEANQPLQRNAGSRPSSGDSSASETPSSLGPRG